MTDSAKRQSAVIACGIFGLAIGLWSGVFIARAEVRGIWAEVVFLKAANRDAEDDRTCLQLDMRDVKHGLRAVRSLVGGSLEPSKDVIELSWRIEDLKNGKVFGEELEPGIYLYRPSWHPDWTPCVVVTPDRSKEFGVPGTAGINGIWQPSEQHPIATYLFVKVQPPSDQETDGTGLSGPPPKPGEAEGKIIEEVIPPTPATQLLGKYQ